MPTTTSMALNVAAGFAAWMSDGEHTRKLGTGICIAVNAALLVFGLVCKEFFIAGTTAIKLIMPAAWSFAVVSIKGRED